MINPNRISFPNKALKGKITFGKDEKSIVYELLVRDLTIIKNEKKDDLIIHMLIIIQTKLVACGEIKVSLVHKLTALLENSVNKGNVHINSRSVVEKIIYYCLHSSFKLFRLNTFFTQSAENILLFLGKNPGDLDVVNLMNAYSNPKQAFRHAASLSQTGNLNDETLALNILKFVGIEEIGKDILLETLSQPFNHLRFVSEILNCYGIDDIGKETIQNLYLAYTSCPVGKNKDFSNANLGYELLKKFGSDIIGRDGINASFYRAIEINSEHQLREIPFAISLIKNYGEFIEAQSLISLYREPRCPNNLLRAIEEYVAGNPLRNIVLRSRQIAEQQVTYRREIAQEVHNFSNPHTQKALSFAKKLILSKSAPVQTHLKPIENFEQLKQIMNKLLDKEKLYKAEKTLQFLFLASSSREKLLHSLTEITTFIINGSFSTLSSDSPEDRLRTWLVNSFVESAGAYDSMYDVSCPAGILDRIFFSGLRGMWLLIDAVFLVPEFAYAQYDMDNPRVQLITSEDFLNKLQEEIKKQNQPLNFNNNKDSTYSSTVAGIPCELIQNSCFSCLKQHLDETFKNHLSPIMKKLTDQELQEINTYFNQLLLAHENPLQVFAKHIFEINGFEELLEKFLSNSKVFLK